MDILKLVETFYNNFRVIKGRYEKGIFGKSVFDNPLYYFKIINKSFDKTSEPFNKNNVSYSQNLTSENRISENRTFENRLPEIIVQYAIHGREYITSYLALCHINDFMLYGEDGIVVFIPVMNPDGVQISLEKNPLHKANGRMVDLNVNFDAKWGQGRTNKRYPSESDYTGEFPFSEPETRALKQLTEKERPDVTISYHSKGEEIYYEFGQVDEQKKRDEILARRISLSTGYEIKSTPFSAGGYKDWCIEKFSIPALTIEVGNDSLVHPIGEENLQDIYLKNKDVINITSRYIMELKGRKNGH